MTVRQDAREKVELAGRVGMVAYGIVHLIIGWLALQVAFGDSGEQADQQGAVQTIAEQPLGKVLLVLVAVGLLMFGIWQLWAAAQGYTWVRDEKKRLRKRGMAGMRGVLSLAIAIYAARMLMGGGGGGSGDTQKTFTAKLLEAPAGQVLVWMVALAVAAVGVDEIVKGVKKKFLEDLDMSKLPAQTKQLTTRLGQVGYPAKGTSVLIIGGLIGYAAATHDPSKAGGLDAALRTIASAPFGMFLLIAIALGFVAFGAYCFADARAHRT